MAKPQGYRRTAKGVIYSDDKELQAMGFSALVIPSLKNASEPVMIVLDSCFHSTEIIKSIRPFVNESGSRPIVLWYTPNSIYYHAINYEQTAAAFWRRMPYLGFWGLTNVAGQSDAISRQALLEIGQEIAQNGFDQQPVMSAYPKLVPDKSQLQLKVCLSSGNPSDLCQELK